MGQPGAGQQSSGQAAMPPDSGDEGDDGSRISCAATVAAPKQKHRRRPNTARHTPPTEKSPLPDRAPTLVARASTTTRRSHVTTMPRFVDPPYLPSCARTPGASVLEAH